ncbi:pyridoxamine 5'-phosphate oxidase family protein [Cupriavidus sp. 2TAF22]|uniref:2Fe-2S iron-sulfur cluster-binding protein n=1 Tax=unclassified Cupriavidus TaxID=2640874 RepID=UPI003F922349
MSQSPLSAPAQLPPLPWHAGERVLQERAGVARKMDELGRRFVRDHMPEQHREFFAQLPVVVLGAVDPDGNAWATLRAGAPGFLHSPHDKALDLGLARDAADPAERGMEHGDAIGLLGIDLLTRRRNRLNGTIRREASGPGATVFAIAVGQSFGNCPQYIQQRNFAFTRDPGTPGIIAPQRAGGLDARARALIAGADTFFVASYADLPDGSRQVDVSHRGGKPGFVRLDDDGGMTIPDFSGNLFFNTLGNFLLNARAGLVFADFATGELLQMTGTAEVILDSPEIAAFQGAERLWRFRPASVVRRADALPLRWVPQADGTSPAVELTGNWDEAAERLRARSLSTAWRPFRVTRLVEESMGIRSFHLEPADGAGLIPHLAGQYLPIRVTTGSPPAPAIRTYTLSSAPSDSVYRISVKREGAVSQHLHDNFRVGDIVEVRPPAGAFTIDAAEHRPAVLLAAGIGVTPMLAMLRHLVYEGLRTRHVRPAYFFHAARTLAERAFARELTALADGAQGAVQYIRVLSDPRDAEPQKDFDEAGRIDTDLLRRHLPFGDYDFYLCGPGPFMQSLYDGLRALNVADDRIHAEAFGPAALHRRRDTHAQAVVAPEPGPRPATAPVPVVFTRSGKEARWSPDAGSLLELAEQRGLAPDFGCRNGSCGTCRTRVVQGAVAYLEAPEFDVPPGEALICCAVPAAPADDAAATAPLQLAL